MAGGSNSSANRILREIAENIRAAAEQGQMDVAELENLLAASKDLSAFEGRDQIVKIVEGLVKRVNMLENRERNGPR